MNDSLLKRILKRIWHDVYIAVSFTVLRPLAMTCRQATEFRNMRYDRSTLFGRIRYHLHLSICEPCTNYLRFSNYLEKSFAAYEVKPLSDLEAANFNQHLIRTFKQS